MTDDEMAGWHHRLDGHEFEQALELVTNREAYRSNNDDNVRTR